MSHFGLLVRVPASTKEFEFENVLEKMMIPYKEAGCGSKDPEELKQYLTFYDVEDECRKDFENGTSTMVRLANGEIHSKYSETFRNPNILEGPQFILPKNATEFEVSHKERFVLFETFMSEYNFYSERDPKHNRYGYWQNSNKKWDYWSIGGRWTGFLEIGYDLEKDKDNYEICFLCNGNGSRPGCESYNMKKESRANHPVIGTGCNGCQGTGWILKFASKFKPVGNYIRISQLNWELIEKEAHKKLNEFWDKWQKLCEGVEFPYLDSPRNTASNLGLVVCKDVPELDGTEWKVQYWDTPNTPEEKKRNRCDVLLQTTKEYLVENYLEYFYPINAWARLDENGWEEKGYGGWFGCQGGTPNSIKQYSKALKKWITNGNQEDWLVIIDCHI